MQGGQDKSLCRRGAELFVISALLLYLELVLIRWIGTEVRVLAYLGNLILVVCFFGVGFGCYRADLPISLTKFGVNLLIVVVLLTNPLNASAFDPRNIVEWLAGFEDSPMWAVFTAQGGAIAAGLTVVAVILYLIAWMLVPVGQMLGRALSEYPRTIHAYSINIAGSLAGVWLFNALSWMATPPVVWFGVLLAFTAVLTMTFPRRNWWAVAAVAAGLILVQLQSLREPRTTWSPYQKLTLKDFTRPGPSGPVQIGYLIYANGLDYQSMVNLSDTFLDAHPGLVDRQLIRFGHYDFPFSIRPSVRRLLVVGAGSGNNAAGALRHGVEQVDCVEIDPQIFALGRRLHPEHPYDSPRVHVVVDDARAFLKRSHEPYDMIWFGLLDTHPGGSFNNRRVDHYVYTMESFQEARRLLSDDGVLVMNFATRRAWVSDRLIGMLRNTFGAEPLAFHSGTLLASYSGSGELTLVCAKRPGGVALPADPGLRSFLESNRVSFAGTTRPTTDDWPYLYLQTAKIPKLHLFAGLIVLGVVVATCRSLGATAGGLDGHFFALGAAFLLLEVQTVSRATLLFGMTWEVNAIVISAVLVMILLANLAAARWPRLPQWLIVAGLAVTIVLLAAVPLDWFNALTGPMKLVAAAAFLTAPVFFAGLIFIRSFAVCLDKAQALGSNLVGALVGGLLESVSFVTGIRALVLLVGLFYVLALWLRPRLLHNLQAAG